MDNGDESNQHPMLADESTDAEVAGFTNCCNGKVGVGALMAILKDPNLRDLVMPSGVRFLSPGGGAEVSNSTNCCNGRVGADPTK